VKEQNELVVQTGLELRLRQLSVEMLNDKMVYIIGSDQRIEYWMIKLHAAKGYHYFLQDGERTVFKDKSILDIPKQYRSKAIVICYDEPSYSGRQCLYHLFGEKLGLKPYQAFVEAMEQTQKNGDAIVFTEEEVMWYPKPNVSTELEPVVTYRTTPVFPSVDMDFFNKKVILELSEVPYLVRSWILMNSNLCEATHVTAGPTMSARGHMYWIIRGFKDGNQIWRDTVIGALPEASIDSKRD